MKYRVTAVALTVALALASGGIAEAGPTDFTNRTSANSSLPSDDVRGVYVDGGGKIYAATQSGLGISIDGGATFSTRLGPAMVLGVYATDDTVFAATVTGLQRSVNGGATFTRVLNEYATGVFARGNTVYVATTNGLWISTDGGTTFPGAAAVVGRGKAVVATDDTVFFATEDSGLLYSANGSPFAVANGLTSGAEKVRSVSVTGSKVYAATEAGLYLSTNGGTNFAPVPAIATASNGVFAQDDTVYVATDNGLYSSTDGGGSFSSASTGLGSVTVLGVFGRGGAVYAATVGGLGITAVAPGAPVVSSVTPFSTTASVAFTADTPGGATTTRLEFALDDTVTVDDSTATVTSPFTLVGLTPRTSYTVYMRTVNAAGTGPWSAGSSFTTISAPGTPVVSSVAPLGTTASVSFTADDSGGSPITLLEFALDDTVTVDDSTATVTSPFTLAGLTPRTSYTVYMRTVNAAGTGPWSAGSSFTTISAPGAPGISIVTPFSTTASVNFSADDSGGSPITLLEFALDDTVTVDDSTATVTSPFTLAGLTPETSYTVYMRTVSAAGTGPWSAGSSFTTAWAKVPAVIATIPVGRQPVGVAISSDDTVYVTNIDDSTVSVINPGSLVQDDTIAVGSTPLSLAVSNDDTVYVTSLDDNAVSVIPPGALAVGQVIPVGTAPIGVAVSGDDSVYVANRFSGTLSVINPGSATANATVAVGGAPIGVAISTDDTVYVGNYSGGFVSVVSPWTLSADETVAVGSYPLGLAVGSDGTVAVANGYGKVSLVSGDQPMDVLEVEVGDYTSNPTAVAFDGNGGVYGAGGAYVTLKGDDRVAILDTRADSAPVYYVEVGNEPSGVAVSESTGLAYVPARGIPGDNGAVSVIAAVTPYLDDTNGAAGSTATIEILLACDPNCPVFDTPVSSVAFGGVPAVGWVWDPDSNMLSGPVPAGSGTVDVSVAFNGGNVASAGTFTYPAPPPLPPGPQMPTMSPTTQVLSGEVGRSVIATSPFTVTNFTSPPSFSIEPALPTGLVMDPAMGIVTGTPVAEYPSTLHRITASAAGSEQSATSILQVAVAAAPAPTPTIVITGNRDEVNGRSAIVITGTSKAVAQGSILRPWIRFRGQTAFTEGGARVFVDDSGTFAWQRATKRKAYVFFQTPDGAVRSNRLTIPAAK